MNYQQKQLSDN